MMDGFSLFRWLLASLHLVALGLGLGAVWMRAGALRRLEDRDDLKSIFWADNIWAIAALLWISTGLFRAFGGFEKGTAYYLNNSLFWIKMALLLGILILEVRPMITLIRWRIASGRGQPVDTKPAAAFARISRVQAGLVMLMVLAATAMARGYGAGAW